MKWWHWIYHGGEWGQSLAEYGRSFLEKKLPNFHHVHLVAFQRALQEHGQVFCWESSCLKKKEIKLSARSVVLDLQLAMKHLTGAQACTVMVKLHTASVELSSFSAWSWELCNVTIKHCSLGYIGQTHLLTLHHIRQSSSYLSTLEQMSFSVKTPESCMSYCYLTHYMLFHQFIVGLFSANLPSTCVSLHWGQTKQQLLGQWQKLHRLTQRQCATL